MSTLKVSGIQIPSGQSGGITNVDGVTTYMGWDSSGNITIPQELSVSGFSKISSISEKVQIRPTGQGGSQTYDFSTGAIYYHPSVISDITLGVTNVPTENSKGYAVSIIISQGSTAYKFTNTITINSVSYTIKWSGSSAPTGSANKIDIFSFSLLNISITSTPSWIVFGSKTDFS